MKGCGERGPELGPHSYPKVFANGWRQSMQATRERFEVSQ